MEALVAQKYRLRNIQDKQKEIMVMKELSFAIFHRRRRNMLEFKQSNICLLILIVIFDSGTMVV